MAISYTQLKKEGFSKGTSHYMKKNTEGEQPFLLNTNLKDRLNQWEKGAIEEDE
jgi:CRISPR-associated protein Cas1